MLVPFSELPDFARIWIYQAVRPLLPEEETSANKTLTDFCSQWQAHGQPLKASFRIIHRQFIVLAIDEDYEGASGCSIDGSVRMLKLLQSQIDNDFFDRKNQAFWVDGKVATFPTHQLQELIRSGTLSATTPVFNNLVPCKSDFEKNWLVPLEKSWVAKYLPKPAFM